ncbi:MAG TPA: cyclic nucleotide-binding domain-containing protein [Anaerolineales bacterium]
MSIMTFELQQADIFYQLTSAQLEKISGIITEKIFNYGEMIFWEGTHSDELYVIAQGEVDILINPSLVSDQPEQEQEPATIATLRRGQSFGEIALIDRGIRSASARAAQANTRLLVIPSDRLLGICDTDPSLGYRLMRNLAADLALKIRNTDLSIRGQLLYRKNFS